MPVKYSFRQISMKDAFSDCQDIFVDDAPSFFQLLDEHFDIQEFIPSVFRNAFYQRFGRKRDYPLEAFLSALILQKIFSIPSDSLLLLFLRLCRELREFCGFSKVPDAPLLTRFKQNFEPYISPMFKQMVDYTEPICQMIDSQLAGILTFDTSGIELYVTENNPKNLNSLIRKLRTFYKDKPEVDPYSMAYGLMPSHAASCPDAKQMYINGHFCYADEDKSVGDASSLVPVLSNFFSLHLGFQPDTFLGNFSFDSAALYGSLLNDFHFSRALIPYNPRNESSLKKVGYNEYGYPTCPNDPSLAMKHCGVAREKGRTDRIKWGCPKVHMVNGQWICDCEKPCSTAKKARYPAGYGRMEQPLQDTHDCRKGH